MNIYEKAIIKFGFKNQKIVAIEELSELQKEITKDLRNIGSKENIIEEMSDVYIMLEQLKIIYNINDEELVIETAKKINRLEKKIENDNL